MVLEFHPMAVRKTSIQTFFLESLGCPKNSVDSRSIAEILIQGGKREVTDPHEADLILVNTCGFIQPAIEESLSVLKKHVQSKRRNQILVAAGCLSEREKSKLLDHVPGLDAALGTRRWADVLHLVEEIESGVQHPYAYFPASSHIMQDPPGVIRAAHMGATAYLKIADGCDRGCAFCTIPFIKGPMMSRPIEKIIGDALLLEGRGVKELILIAQDTTAYGRDLGMRDGLVPLLESLLEQVHGLPWIRIMYTFPGSVSDALIRLMADEHRILPYLDIPLQHAHPEVLKRMHRPANMRAMRERFREMRVMIPGLAIRTAFIVGFPGESEAEFLSLRDFLEEVRFDHVGFFPYYHEPHTPAYQFEDLGKEVKNDRLHVLAALQEDISLENNKNLIGKSMDILVEGTGDGLSIGRSYRDAPEIDGLVILNEILETGKIYPVRVTGALIHDLIAERD